MQKLIVRRQIILFRTQSDVLATAVMFTQYLSEYLFEAYFFSTYMQDSERFERIIQFGVIGVCQAIGLCISQRLIKWKERSARHNQGAGLPEGKKFHVFLSHKKERLHTEALTVSLKDQLTTLGFQSFFDKDNLDQISLA